MRKKSFEILEHTADVGLRAFGASLPEVFENAAQGMSSLLVAPATVRAEQRETVEVQGADGVDLLVSWLHELLYRFDTRRWVVAKARVEEMREWSLRAVVEGETLDLKRHELGMEIKAVTYHGARVEQSKDGWVAEVLFDV